MGLGLGFQARVYRLRLGVGLGVQDLGHGLRVESGLGRVSEHQGGERFAHGVMSNLLSTRCKRWHTGIPKQT